MHLVVGLGNPGRRYARNRHNVGFLVVDRLAERWGGRVESKQLGALTDRIRIRNHDVLLAKPQSYMNLSGQPTVSLKGYYKLDLENLIVVHDEVDLPFGRVQIKQGGGHNGHNGLRDVQAKLGNNGFTRIRVGVSRPPEGWDTADYVLGNWTPSEEADIGSLVDRAADAVEACVSEGARSAMNTFNVRAERTPPTPSDDAAPSEAASSDSHPSN